MKKNVMTIISLTALAGLVGCAEADFSQGRSCAFGVFPSSDEEVIIEEEPAGEVEEPEHRGDIGEPEVAEEAIPEREPENVPATHGDGQEETREDLPEPQ